MRIRYCRHCRADPTRRANRLCDACHAYERKYGRLPDSGVLVRRWTRRHESGARLAG